MAIRRRREPRLAVRIPASVWRQEVECYEQGSEARLAAERERSRLERDGLAFEQLEACAELGPEGTRLKGLVKAYVPISDAPASERPFGFVFDGGRDERGLYLALVAFGERHPARPAVRSVYERAHKRLHGRYPDQYLDPGRRRYERAARRAQHERPAERRALLVRAAAPSGTAAKPCPRRRPSWRTSARGPERTGGLRLR